MQKIIVLCSLLALAISPIPPTIIVSKNIEFNNATVAAGSVVYQASWGSSFIVTPNAGLAWTGIEHVAISGTPTFGWKADFLAVTQHGATIIFTPFFGYTTIKFKYIATQGDRLQVFILEFHTQALYFQAIRIPFDYAAQVKFDSANLPQEVFVGAFVTSFQTASIGFGYMNMAVFPAIYR